MAFTTTHIIAATGKGLARMSNRIPLSALAGGMLVLLTADAAAQTSLVVTPGSDPAATLTAAVRFRNFSTAAAENEIWIGAPPLGAPPASEGADLAWSDGLRVNVSYHPDSGLLAANVSDWNTGGVPIPVAFVAKQIGNIGLVNYAEITIATQVPEAHMFLGGVLNPPGTGFGSCPGCLIAGISGNAPGTYRWKVTGIDLTGGFSFDGVAAASAIMTFGASDYVEIAFGYVPPPDTTGPQISSLAVGPTPLLLNGSATLTAAIDDSSPRGPSISGAVYTLNGTPIPLTAVDGAFDEASEDVAATFPLIQLGVNEVCVQATDALNNTGPAVCQQFIVTYKFTGFFSPVDNVLVNGAVAGQTVPVRWQLADANDIPVSNPQAIWELVSYPISCADFSGAYLDSIEEYAAGSGGLLSLGDGTWQFNWKTPPVYSNTCRAMYIAFANGTTSPIVKFSFK